MGSVLCVALLLFTHVPVATAETGSIGIIPAFPKEGNLRSHSIFIHTLKGGESVDDGVRVYNYTKESRTVKIDAVDSIAASDGSFSCKQNSEDKTEVGAWVTVSSKEVTIPAETNELVTFTINVPKGVDPGEHGACITAQDTKNMGSKEKSGIILGFRNAIRMAITVPGKIVKKLTIMKIDVGRNEKGNYTVSPVSHNGGNVSLDVTSRVQLRGMFGEETKVQSATYPVIARATTGWAFEFKQPFWGGFYRAYTSIAYDADPSSGLGDKTGKEQKVRKDTGYFFMMPTPKALAVELAVPLLIIFAIFTFLRRRYLRKVAPKKLLKYTVAEGDTIVSIAQAHGVKWKRLARVNGLKVPYLLVEGETVYIPKRGRLPKKPKRLKAEEDWLVEKTVRQEPKATSGKKLEHIEKHPVTGTKSATELAEESVPVQNDWISPRSASPSYPHAARSYVPNPQFPEPDDSDFPDWREGATDEELMHLGVLKDSASIPKLQNTFEVDAETEESAPKKKSAPKTRKKPAKKKTKRTAKK